MMAGISKRYPGVVALNDVSLHLDAGEIVALLGENGAGKSTLMNILGGVVQPDAGTVTINGNRVHPANPSDALKCGIAFVHQELSVLDNLDVAGNICLGREPQSFGIMNKRQMHEISRVATSRVGLDISPSAALSDLPIAHRQLIEIARALAQDAKILILDEPTSSLTPSETSTLMGLLRDIKQQGVSVVYITHRLGEVIAIADRAVVLRDGEHVADLMREDLTHDKMVTAMVGRNLTRDVLSVAPAQGRVLLDVQNLTTRRNPTQGATFSLHEGEIVGMAGLVGAGRTELAEALFGINPAVSGTLTLNGKSLVVQNPQHAIENKIYLVPEDRRHHGLVISLSIRENISLPDLSQLQRFGLVNRKQESDIAAERGAALTVKAPTIEMPVANLSGGNQQKVVLARWLALSPAVMIFDEPTRGIDVGAKDEIYRLIRELAASQVAVLVISSDMEEILRISDRVLVLRDGEVTGSILRNEATEEAILRMAVHHD